SGCMTRSGRPGDVILACVVGVPVEVVPPQLVGGLPADPRSVQRLVGTPPAVLLDHAARQQFMVSPNDTQRNADTGSPSISATPNRSIPAGAMVDQAASKNDAGGGDKPQGRAVATSDEWNTERSAKPPSRTIMPRRCANRTLRRVL